MSNYPPLPQDLEEKLRRARRLEWWTLIWMVSIVVLIYLVMGNSQAMKSAWIEDMLSLIPPILFLVTARIERVPPNRKYPYVLHRAGTLAFALAAAALSVMGGYLVYDAASVLLRQEHPTIGSMQLFGTQVWMGWLMMAALVYSVVPPVVLGRRKAKLARPLQDKVLHADAQMNAADWKTGLAGILGLTGIAFGLWWADAVAAGLIGFDILKDGLKSLRTSVAELLDGAPRQLDNNANQQVVDQLNQRIAEDRHLPAGAVEVKIREAGRYLHVVLGSDTALRPDPAEAERLFGPHAWRVVTLAGSLEAEDRRPLAESEADPSTSRRTPHNPSPPLGDGPEK
ncbi:cation transporter [Pseudohoeflea coraliihabitans]|uniref:Cation transporter n=1 Tax=Pseudohoeflea coraliihabitans TaxID=2860393 RepID=A0ABS6WMU1_9HYPH|nr:cation transporter [Pseudohoeflea sp. DP4N28-3]MBW3097277.1 cation transporter [Pseudohoeflea sp. DP4N28-3]